MRVTFLIHHCHCCGLGSIPGLETSTCQEHNNNKKELDFPVVAAETNPTGGIRFLASLSGLKSQRCHELWCRSQMLLGSDIAVAMA